MEPLTFGKIPIESLERASPGGGAPRRPEPCGTIGVRRTAGIRKAHSFYAMSFGHSNGPRGRLGPRPAGPCVFFAHHCF